MASCNNSGPFNVRIIQPESTIIDNSTEYEVRGVSPIQVTRTLETTSDGKPLVVFTASQIQTPVQKPHLIQFIFQSSTTQPQTPLSNTSPSGWSITPPSLVSGQHIWVSRGEVTTDTTPALVGSWSTPTQFSGNDGTNGSSTLVTELNTSSRVTQRFSDTGFIGPQQTKYSTWQTIENTSSIDRHVLVKFSAGGANNVGFNDNYLRGSVDYGLDGISSAYSSLSTTVGPSWTETMEFGNNSTEVAVYKTLFGMSVHTIPANSTLYFRSKFENLGTNTLIIETFTFNLYLL